MNILINCSNLKVGGGMQVAHSFLTMISNKTDDRFTVVLSAELQKQIDTAGFSDNFEFHTYTINATPKNAVFSSNAFLDRLVQENNIERVFSVFGPTYWRPKVLHICGYAKPHYIYKTSPFFKNLSLKAKLALFFKEKFHLYDFRHNSDVNITESKDVSAKLRKILGREVHTVTNTYNQIFDHPENWSNKIILPPFNGAYLLTISANYPHKNLKIIPEIIKIMQQRQTFNIKFVLTIDESELEIDEAAKQHVVFLGKVNIDQCPSLYQQSDFMFLPTLLECFSAAYPEAMKMKKPILTSNLDFATNICKDAAIYFNPMNAVDIYEKISQLQEDKVLRQALIASGEKMLTQFDTARERAEKYLNIIKS